MSSNDRSVCESDISLEKWSDWYPVTYNDATCEDKSFLEFMNNQVYPNFVNSDMIKETLASRLLKTEYGKIGLFGFDYWRNHCLSERRFDDEDRYEVQTWLMHLACSWMSSVSKRKMNEPSYACKNGVESLIELSFQLRTGTGQVWQQDAEMVLPDEPESVTADSITLMKLPPYFKTVFSRTKPAYPFSWSYANSPDSVVTFVFVASKDDSNEKATLERLQMCFFSAHLHRRALCCEDGLVFGAVLHEGAIRFHVSFWDGDTLTVQPILRPYGIRDLGSFLESYFVLCRMSEHQSEFLHEQFKRWKSDTRSFRERIGHSCKRPWRKWAVGDFFSSSAEQSADDTRATTGIDSLRIAHVSDRKARLLLDRIRRGPYSPQLGYPLTRRNKKAFDVITDAVKSGDLHGVQSVRSWADATYANRDEYEDPAPYLSGGDGCSDLEYLDGKTFSAVGREERGADLAGGVTVPLRLRLEAMHNRSIEMSSRPILEPIPELPIMHTESNVSHRVLFNMPRLRRVHSDHAIPIFDCASIMVN